MTTRILLADDHAIVCDGLRTLLDAQPDLSVVAVAHDGATAVRLAREHAPDVAVLDVAMPELNGIDATRQLLSERPALRVIALSMHSDRRYVTGMLAAGAAGYLLKDSAFEELAQAIRTVLAGRVYLSPGIAGIVTQELTRHAAGLPTAPAGPALTDREREVLQLLAEGYTARQIAARLCRSVKTVETHRRRLMEKVGVATLAELTKYALREGMTSL
jgi:DNA-binding NarL/FixJ family response regulator